MIANLSLTTPNNTRLLIHLSFAVLLSVAAAQSKAQVLFDPALGTLPGEQGWSFFGLGSFSQTITNIGVLFDTSSSLATQAGYGWASATPLDRTAGFKLHFRFQLHSGTVANTNRSGFSVILLDQEKRALNSPFGRTASLRNQTRPCSSMPRKPSFRSQTNSPPFLWPSSQPNTSSARATNFSSKAPSVTTQPSVAS